MRYKSVVFVCLANASRSIMAEVICTMVAQNSELQDSRICARSAGIDGSWEGLKTAGDAQLQLYRRVIEWDDRYRIAYGADLYACLLKNFADQLGFGLEFGQQVRERFSQSIERHLEDLHSGREQPLVLQHIATTDGPIFSPLGHAAEAAK